jgi:predicted nuclease of predicted toxin-antitoxin system
VAERIRFHLDEQVDPDIARALRRYDIDLTTTIEVGLRTQSDAVQLTFVRQQGRVLITHDTDFLRLARQNTDHPGIAFGDRTTRSIGDMIRSLILIYEILTPDEMKGRVEYL